MKKVLIWSLVSGLCLVACQPRQEMPLYDTVNVVENLVIDEDSVPIFPKKAALTTDTARRFALDLPKRCSVDWNNQNVISVIPAEPIEVVRIARGDKLPEFMVSDFTFKDLSVSAVLNKLLDGTNIVVVEDEPLSIKISGDIVSGELSDTLDLITKMGGIYYSYNADSREIHLFHRAKWLMKMPQNTDMIMAIMDAMRGANMRNLLVDWNDKTLVFEGNHQTEREVNRIIADIDSKHNLIAWDIDVYRVYPKSDNPILWMNMLPAFGEKNVRMSVPGVVGRGLVVSPEINTKTLQDFMAIQANIVLISQGTFVLPNGWQTRFDIGQCSREERLETDLIIGATASYGDFGGRDKIDAKIVLGTQNGELSSFKLPSSLGDNYIFVGIPTHSFVTEDETLISPWTELVIFASPRIIKITDVAQTKLLSGDELRDYLIGD